METEAVGDIDGGFSSSTSVVGGGPHAVDVVSMIVVVSTTPYETNRLTLPPGPTIVAVDPADSDLPQGAEVTSPSGKTASTQLRLEIAAGEAVSRKFGFRQQSE